jgi:hypothetical protein
LYESNEVFYIREIPRADVDHEQILTPGLSGTPSGSRMESELVVLDLELIPHDAPNRIPDSGVVG